MVGEKEIVPGKAEPTEYVFITVGMESQEYRSKLLLPNHDLLVYLFKCSLFNHYPDTVTLPSLIKRPGTDSRSIPLSS